jgi:hypothetical protein
MLFLAFWSGFSIGHFNTRPGAPERTGGANVKSIAARAV